MNYFLRSHLIGRSIYSWELFNHEWWWKLVSRVISSSQSIGCFSRRNSIWKKICSEVFCFDHSLFGLYLKFNIVHCRSKAERCSNLYATGHYMHSKRVCFWHGLRNARKTFANPYVHVSLRRLFFLSMSEGKFVTNLAIRSLRLINKSPKAFFKIVSN